METKPSESQYNIDFDFWIDWDGILKDFMPKKPLCDCLECYINRNFPSLIN